MLVGTVIIGNGLTVMLKVVGKPTHVNAEGVTVKTPVIGANPKFVPLKLAIFPVPLAPIPIPAFVFVQL